MVKRYFADASAHGESAMPTTTASAPTEERGLPTPPTRGPWLFPPVGHARVNTGLRPPVFPARRQHLLYGDRLRRGPHYLRRRVWDPRTGAVANGRSAAQDPPLFTHTHWDHIQGFPFFAPTLVPGFEIDVYAPPNVDKDIESIFRGQLDRAYFFGEQQAAHGDVLAHTSGSIVVRPKTPNIFCLAFFFSV